MRELEGYWALFGADFYDTVIILLLWYSTELFLTLGLGVQWVLLSVWGSYDTCDILLLYSNNSIVDSNHKCYCGVGY